MPNVTSRQEQVEEQRKAREARRQALRTGTGPAALDAKQLLWAAVETMRPPDPDPKSEEG
jgi:hypothetical protein